MRLATLLPLTTTALLLIPGVALGHLTHDGCAQSRTVVPGPIHVDAYTLNCTGVTVSVPNTACPGTDIHVGHAHILILWDTDCQTGVILEVLRGDQAVALAP